MKTPEEIKLGLECCQHDPYSGLCQCDKGCPYRHKGPCDKLRKDALAYIQQLEAAAPKWISVEEKKPHEYETVIVCTKDGYVYAAQYFGNEMWRRELIGCARSCTDVIPTHWMPLPSAEGLNDT